MSPEFQQIMNAADKAEAQTINWGCGCAETANFVKRMAAQYGSWLAQYIGKA